MTDDSRAETEDADHAEHDAPHAFDEEGHEEGGEDGGGGRRRRIFRRERKKPLSEVLTTIARDEARDYIAVGDLLALLGGRGRAALIRPA